MGELYLHLTRKEVLQISQAKPDIPTSELSSSNMQYTSNPKIKWLGSSSVAMVEQAINSHQSVGKIIGPKRATSTSARTVLVARGAFTSLDPQNIPEKY